MTSTRIGIVGERIPDFPPHVATDAALEHTAASLGVDLQWQWIPTDEELPPVDAIWCAPGSPYRSLEGALAALRLRPRAGRADARHLRRLPAHDPGVRAQRARLRRRGARRVRPRRVAAVPDAARVRDRRQDDARARRPDTRAAALYGGALEVDEQYYCNFGLNPEYRELLEDGGLRITAADADGEPRVFELDDHPFYVATLFVPQMRSQPGRPHPVVAGFVQAAVAVRA